MQIWGQAQEGPCSPRTAFLACSLLKPPRSFHFSTLQGAEGTVYEGLTFRLSLNFGTEYPFKAPLVKFETSCFHPNVDLQGNICLDILKEKWSGTMRLAPGKDL